MLLHSVHNTTAVVFFFLRWKQHSSESQPSTQRAPKNLHLLLTAHQWVGIFAWNFVCL